MDVRTYRAATMHEALELVRCELGPEAAVLHTREVRRTRWFGLLPGMREIEVTASAGMNVPSRLPPNRFRRAAPHPAAPAASPDDHPPAPGPHARPRAQPHSQSQPHVPPQPPVPTEIEGQLSDLQKMVEELCRQQGGHRQELPEELFRLFTELLDAELGEELARELIDRVRAEAPDGQRSEPDVLRARVARIVEEDLRVAGPISVAPGRVRVAALVGPTGVGKTTTIAKLAANFRLREKRRVGLITVDTYRIAAVEQLRTYADIIDLPMQVVSSPREMREAVRRFHDLDLLLIDTAGRSPKDEVKIRELRAFLSEAEADEVHLVLSSVAGHRALVHTARHFAAVGPTALILTKLDETTGLGGVLPLVRSSRLPLSYLTDGQNVPDDIQTAEPRRLARLILAGDPSEGN